MTTAQERHIRNVVRKGNRMKRRRVELRKLDDKHLLALLGKYMGRTPSEIKWQFRNRYSSGIDRNSIIDGIVRMEEPE